MRGGVATAAATRRKQERMVDERSESEAEAEGETVHIKVFRYDPEVEGKQEPRFDDFYVPFEKG